MIDQKQAVIDAMYAAYHAGDVAGALSHCAPDAQYHCITPIEGEWATFAGTHPMDVYFKEILPKATGLEGYRIESMDGETIDDLVISRVRTTHGSGAMVFRVTDAGVTDIWVINGRGRETTGPF